MHDDTNVTQGNCEAVGCPVDKQPKRLCTTCFFKMLDNGSIATKSGGDIRKRPRSYGKGKGSDSKGKGKEVDGKGKGKGDYGRGKGKGAYSKGKGRYSNHASISTKAIVTAWTKANSAAATDNSNDATLPGPPRPKSSKMNANDDVEQRTKAMAAFAERMNSMGVKLQ